MNEPLDAEQRGDTYMNHLQDAGYHTALLGRHHFIDRYHRGRTNRGPTLTEEEDEEIRAYGFDHVWQTGAGKDRYFDHLAEKGILDEYKEAKRERAWSGGEFPYETDDFVDSFIGNHAVEYVETYDRDAPFYLNVSFHGPHPPYWVPDEFDTFDPSDVPPPKGIEDSERIAEIRRLRAKYAGRISLIDHYVGELIDTLDTRGVLDETFVVFTADHGDNIGDHGIMDKRHFYEQCVRVPLVMRGPGIEVTDRVSRVVRKELVSNVDLYPTFLSVADHEAGCGGTDREGHSLLPIANGDPSADRRDAVFSEQGTAMMVRTGNWKVVFDPEQGGVQQLFNLRNDPEELDNLAGIPEYAGHERDHLGMLLERMIRRTNHTHEKEQRRVQTVRQ